MDDVCHNYFSILPDKLPGDIHGIPSGQSRAPATRQNPEKYEGWHAVIEYGQTPALEQYNRLVAQLRQNGPRPSTLAGKSLDELLNELAEVEKSRRVLSLAAHVPAAIESSLGVAIVSKVMPMATRLARAAGILISARDFGLSLWEGALEDEIMRRVDYDPDDSIDDAFVRSRVRDMGLQIDFSRY